MNMRIEEVVRCWKTSIFKNYDLLAGTNFCQPNTLILQQNNKLYLHALPPLQVNNVERFANVTRFQNRRSQTAVPKLQVTRKRRLQTYWNGDCIYLSISDLGETNLLAMEIKLKT